jgi:hypothetical protein
MARNTMEWYGINVHHQLVTRWFFRVPVERIWAELMNVNAFDTWWPGLERVRLRPPHQELAPGAFVDFQVRGPFNYLIRFSMEVTELVPPTLVTVRSTGRLAGAARWLVGPHEGGSSMSLFWEGQLTNPVFRAMALFPPLVKLLDNNHRKVMQAGYEALRKRVDGG